MTTLKKTPNFCPPLNPVGRLPSPLLAVGAGVGGGEGEGAMDGARVGGAVGTLEGFEVGEVVGAMVGVAVVLEEGGGVGAMVGATLCASAEMADAFTAVLTPDSGSIALSMTSIFCPSIALPWGCICVR